MFKVVAEPRKRRVCPPRAVAASVVFHLLLLAGIAAALSNTGREWPLDGGFVEFPPPPPPRPMDAFPRPSAQPRESRDPRPANGQTARSEARTIEPPLPPSNMDLLAVMPDRYSDAGPIGDAPGQREPNPPAPNAGPGGDHDGGLPIFAEVLDGGDITLDTHPELANQRQARLILQRDYPPLLRDIGATGRTVVQLIIGTDGRAEPGSVRVLESTDRAFNDAAIHAAERFRFKPATVNGRRVAVLVTIPIEWRVEN